MLPCDEKKAPPCASGRGGKTQRRHVNYPQLKHVGLQVWFPSLTIGVLTTPATQVLADESGCSVLPVF